MRKLWSCVRKELLLLCRDRAGLLVIFLMPVVLVIVVTLVQENVLRSMGETKTRVLFLDKDSGSVGRQMEEIIRKSGVVAIVKEVAGKQVDVETAKLAVAKGNFQCAVVISEGTTKAFMEKAREAVENSLSASSAKARVRKERPRESTPRFLIYFDPALSETLRLGLASLFEKVSMDIVMKEKMRVFSEVLPVHLESAAKKAMGPIGSVETRKLVPSAHIDWDNTPIIVVEEKTAQYGTPVLRPNTVQQNVPAWTLFGMFFIIVPLAGSLIRERQTGMLIRLFVMPLSYLAMISGKIISYVIICLVQFTLIMAIGRFVLPIFGAPVLNVGSSPAALVLIAVSAGLAASGYGILLGTVARTYEQASMFGAVSVVICAALGGIMVPVYVMPKVMQSISILSPLSWGLRAFQEVFVRGGTIRSVLPDTLLMLLFFVTTTLIAWFYMCLWERTRIQ
ncbi:MAG: ABC transporter permease [Syntrophorhabdaceae bacterium]